MFGKNLKQIVLVAVFFFYALSSQILDLPVPKGFLLAARRTLRAMKRQIIVCERSARTTCQGSACTTSYPISSHKYSCDKNQLFNCVNRVDHALNDIEQYLQKQGANNIIIGNTNRIIGEDNIIIGNENSLKGDDNWIIEKSGYNGTGDNFLVFHQWAIDMNKKNLILVNPWLAIKRISQDAPKKWQCEHDVKGAMRSLFHYH